MLNYFAALFIYLLNKRALENIPQISISNNINTDGTDKADRN